MSVVLSIPSTEILNFPHQHFLPKKQLCLYLLSLDRIQLYFSFGFIPEKLKWSWFIVLATTAFSRSVDHRVSDNLRKKKFSAYLKLHAIFQSYLTVGLAKLGYLWYGVGKD